MKADTLRITGIVLATFAVYFIIDDLYFYNFRAWLDQFIHQKGVSHIISYVLFGIPLFAGILLLHPLRNFFSSLGLQGSVIKAMTFSFICTLPMLLGYLFIFDFNREVTFNEILIGVIAAAFFEEVYFRGFLFGQLYRFTRLGFFPSVIVGAILFAVIHLYQSQDLLTLLGIFLVTFLGAGIFAWVYIEWQHSIWVPIFLHLFMNLIWLLFSAGENSLGGIYSNIFRVGTILLIIGLTILYKKRNGMKLEINRSTLWMKKPIFTQPNQ
jgi:membrane protease YdiL (CAAX protease family)